MLVAGQGSKKQRQKRKGLLRLLNLHTVTSGTFCWSVQGPRPAQIQSVDKQPLPFHESSCQISLPHFSIYHRRQYEDPRHSEKRLQNLMTGSERILLRGGSKTRTLPNADLFLGLTYCTHLLKSKGRKSQTIHVSAFH